MEALMKIAILSDIHSNIVALKECVKIIEQQEVDGIFFLGDYISDCPEPQATLKKIRQLEKKYKCWFIKGNREEYFVHHADGAEDGWKYSSYKGSLLYTYENLKEEDIELFRNYPIYLRVEIPGTAPILLVHGSPKSTRELLYPKANNTNEYMKKIEEDYLICGHTHLQFAYEYNHKILINPGSLGVAIGINSAAHMAFLNWNEKTQKWKYEFLKVPYLYSTLSEWFAKSDLMEKGKLWPKFILKSIESGINVGPICAKWAFDMAKSDGDPLLEHTIPEKYWEIAALKLGIV